MTIRLINEHYPEGTIGHNLGMQTGKVMKVDGDRNGYIVEFSLWNKPIDLFVPASHVEVVEV